MGVAAHPASPGGVVLSHAPGGWLRRLAGSLALALASTALALLALEGAARLYVHRRVEGAPGTVAHPLAVYDAELGWAKPPGESAVVQRPEFVVHLAVNAHGLRGPDRPYEKRAGVRRVLLLGDSFTEAATVEEEESARAVMEGLLNARGGPRFEVINGGTAGYATDQEYLFYRRQGARYAPDVVALVFYYNDLLGVLGAEGNKPYFELQDGRLVLRNSPVPPPPEGWGRDRRNRFVLRPWRHSYALRLLSSRTAAGNPELHRLLARMGLTEPFDDTTPAEMWPFGLGHRTRVAEMWRREGALLAALRDEVRAHGGRLLIGYAPAAFECDQRTWDLTCRRYHLDPRWSRDRVFDDLARLARELEVPLVDPRAELRAAQASGVRAYYVQDDHWTAAGNRIVAQALARAVGE